MFTIIKQHECDSLTEFSTVNQVGAETTSISPNNGHCGSCIKSTINSSNTEIGIRDAFTSSDAVKIVRFYYRLANENLTGNLTIAHGWYEGAGNSFAGELFDITLVRLTNNSFNIRLVDLVNNTVVTSPRTYYTDRAGIPSMNCFNLCIKNDGLEMYINDGVYPADYGDFTPECVITGAPNFAGKVLGAISIGKYFSTGYSGDVFIDTIKYSKAQTTVSSNLQDQMNDTIDGIMWRQLCPSGAVVKSNQDTNNFVTFYDIVGEATTYALKECIIADRRADFDKIQGFVESTLIRVHGTPENCLGGNLSTDPGELNLQGFLYNPRLNKFIDLAIAGDDIADEIESLLIAHKKWGSTSTLNYKSLALTKAKEIKDKGHYTNAQNKLRYFSLDERQFYLSGKTHVQTNMSYFNWVMCRLLKEHTDDQFWDQCIEGGYDMLNKTTATTGVFATTTGLPTEWHSYVRATGVLQRDPFFSNTAQFNPNIDLHYGYNAFRVFPRVLLDYILFDEPRAKTYLSGNVYQFLKNEWDSGGIKAEYEHDGTVRSNYETALFYSTYLAVFLGAGDLVRYNAIYTSKIKSRYASTSMGGIYDNAGYFLNDWVVMCIAFYEGYYTPLAKLEKYNNNFIAF